MFPAPAEPHDRPGPEKGHVGRTPIYAQLTPDLPLLYSGLAVTGRREGRATANRNSWQKPGKPPHAPRRTRRSVQLTPSSRGRTAPVCGPGLSRQLAGCGRARELPADVVLAAVRAAALSAKSSVCNRNRVPVVDRMTAGGGPGRLATRLPRAWPGEPAASAPPSGDRGPPDLLWDVRGAGRFPFGPGNPSRARMAAMSSARTPCTCRWSSAGCSIAGRSCGSAWAARATSERGGGPRGNMARAASTRAAALPCEQGRQACGTYAHNNPALTSPACGKPARGAGWESST